MNTLRVALAQINPTVGALTANREKMDSQLEEARARGAQLVVFPELALTGYPPEDLLRSQPFLLAVRRELENLTPASRGLLAVIGMPLLEGSSVFNAAVLLHHGRWVDSYCKGTLPNYGVFDEKRYFRPGLRCPVYRWGAHRFGVNICEDIWAPAGVPAVQARGGARFLLNLSSSPYHAGKGRERESLLRHRARQHGVAILYTNLVGGQDELVFDGESMVVDAGGRLRARAVQFREQLLIIDLEEDWLQATSSSEPDFDFVQPQSESIAELESLFFLDPVQLEPPPGPPPEAENSPAASLAASHAVPRAVPRAVEVISTRLEGEEEIYQALILGVRDYVRKNRFSNVVIGLSGGIDSALTAVLAADALGAGQVLGVSMPSRFSSETSRAGARELARNLGLELLEFPIDSLVQISEQALAPRFRDRPRDATEENLQARIRGLLLMAISNKEGRLVLTTGNKSELAVGYCTLYGDMAGGFAVLKDVPKTLVFKLARWRNRQGAPIPEDTLTRPPSAELSEGQLDTDRLPPYEVLDAILEAKVEREEEPDQLLARGFDPVWVERIYNWIDANEYKRRQAPPGIKITPRAFGRDRRYPITNEYRWTRQASPTKDA